MSQEWVIGPLSARFESMAIRNRKRAAVTADKRMLTWLELRDQVHAYSRWLHAYGVRPGNHIGMVLPPSLDFVIAFFAVAQLGAVAAPADTTLAAPELHARLFGCRAVIASDTARLAPTGLQTLPPPEHTAASQPSNAPPNGFACDPNIDADLLVLYSSGTAGCAKPVVRTQADLLAEVTSLSMATGVNEEDRFLCTLSLAHAHGLCNAMLAALCNGASLFLTDSVVPNEILQLLETHRITVFPTVPFLMEAVGRSVSTSRPKHSAMRLCFTAGAPLRRETFEKVRARFGVEIRQLYGSTETGAVTINMDGDIDGTSDSVGTPLKGVSIRSIASNTSEPEIAVRSNFMARGYYRGPGEEPDVASISEGFFLTGDLGQIDDVGRLRILGRRNLLLTVAGKKVNPLEVETVLRRHPNIDDAAVYGVPGRFGNDEIRALLVTNSGCQEYELVRFCASHLARYKIPRVFEFRHAIPRTPLGKLKRELLA